MISLICSYISTFEGSLFEFRNGMLTGLCKTRRKKCDKENQ
ncbi:hypothetical protein HMPREF1366_01864 [Enterococcus faecium ERV26]|nr:hypothetical protein HMPREF1366_01864 [Enterococcus faecium ERV26]